jgi:hypothetical protein
MIQNLGDCGGRGHLNLRGFHHRLLATPAITRPFPVGCVRTPTQAALAGSLIRRAVPCNMLTGGMAY